MKKYIEVYIVWIWFKTGWNYFEIYSDLQEATAISNKIAFGKINTRITVHQLGIDVILETTEGDLIKDLEV